MGETVLYLLSMSFTFSSIWTTAILSGLFCIFSCNKGYSQVKQDTVVHENINSSEFAGSGSNFKYSFKTANPKAQKLMKEDFFWSPIEETGPFGNDDGSDAAYGFYQWRHDNKHADPMSYLNDLIAGWNYPYFDPNELDSIKIQNYIAKDVVFDDSTLFSMKQGLKNMAFKDNKEMSDSEINQTINASKNMGITFLTGQDEAIIATGFAQLVLEGMISPELKKLTVIAIKRQLLPLLLTRYPVDYQKTRRDQLTKMLYVIRNCY